MPHGCDQLARKGTLDNQSKQPSITKARGSLKVQSSNKSFAQSSIDNVKSRSDIIEIPATDAVIHEVNIVNEWFHLKLFPLASTWFSNYLIAPRDSSINLTKIRSSLACMNLIHYLLSKYLDQASLLMKNLKLRSPPNQLFRNTLLSVVDKVVSPNNLMASQSA